MTTITAQPILRSRNACRPDKVLSTLLLRYPRFIHSEFMTHRALSKNAGSSRAIPVKKIIDSILYDTAMPIHWGANQRGMQADQECDAKITLSTPDKPWPLTDCVEELSLAEMTREQAWIEARDRAIDVARAYDAAGYHKQIVNRILEPYMHITVVVSGTEWDNFLELRTHKDAEPHFQMLARAIEGCLTEAPVQLLQPGEWHLPFIDRSELYMMDLETAKKISVACCASTSYKTVDGFDMTKAKAEDIFHKLVTSKPLHASPLEHVAQADLFYPAHENDHGWQRERWEHPEQHANFVGFRQYRHQL